MSTCKDRKGPPQDESQDEEVQEEGILLAYPNQKYDQNERQERKGQ